MQLTRWGGFEFKKNPRFYGVNPFDYNFIHSPRPLFHPLRLFTILRLLVFLFRPQVHVMEIAFMHLGIVKRNNDTKVSWINFHFTAYITSTRLKISSLFFHSRKVFFQFFTPSKLFQLHQHIQRIILALLQSTASM